MLTSHCKTSLFILILSLSLVQALPTKPVSAGSGSGSCSVEPLLLYVDCDRGSDASGDGSPAAPFLSPNKARDAIRLLPRPLQRPVLVKVAGECRPSDLSTPVLELNDSERDSGDSSFRITYSADAPRGGSSLLGALKLPSVSEWPTFKGEIRMLRLDSFEVQRSMYGTTRAGGGLGQCTSDRMELFYGGMPMTRARYPNLAPDGMYRWLRISEVIDGQKQFVTNNTRVLGWSKEADPWIHGYWGYDWADTRLPLVSAVKKSDAQSIVTTSGRVLYGFAKNARFYGENLFSELDAPGEYYINQSTGTLFFWPPTDGGLHESVYVSTADYVVTLDGRNGKEVRAAEERALAAAERKLSSTLPLSADARKTHSDAREGHRVWKQAEVDSLKADTQGGVEFVTLEGFRIGMARRHGVFGLGLNRVEIRGGSVSLVGQHGMWLDGDEVSVNGAKISHCGGSAVALSGGNLGNLTGGGNLVQGCEIFQNARVTRCYTPGVHWLGMGHRVVGNLIRDQPHSGVLGAGNDGIFQDNHFLRLLYEVSDSGAWDSDRSWTRRGHTLSNNTFESTKNTVGMTLGFLHTVAIYFDDMLSGNQVVNNTFIDVDVAILIGGGRDYLISNNRFIDVAYGGINIDNRGSTWDAYLCTYNTTLVGRLPQEMISMHYERPPYATKYPNLAVTLYKHPCLPWGLSIVRNKYCRVHKQRFIYPVKEATVAEWGGVFADNEESCEQGGVIPLSQASLTNGGSPTDGGGAVLSRVA